MNESIGLDDYYDFKELYFNKMGSYNLLDSLFIFVSLPFGIVGFVLNLISLISFLKINFSKPILKDYLAIYSFVSIVVCFITIFYPFSRQLRTLQLAYSYFMSLIRCKLIGLGITLYFFVNLIDCIILFERISNFNDCFKIILKIKPYLVCIGIILLTNIINLPSYLVNNIRKETDFNYILKTQNQTYLDDFSYCEKNLFFYTNLGSIIIYLTTFIRDILTQIIQITISIYSIYMFKRYLNKKVYLNHLSRTIIVSNINQNNYTESRYSKANNVSIGSIIIQNKILTRVETFNIRLTKMTIYLSIITIFSHFGLLLIYISYGSDNNSAWAHYMTFLTIIIVQLKYISNFLFFYFFNKKFRIYVHRIIVALSSIYMIASDGVTFLVNCVLD